MAGKNKTQKILDLAGKFVTVSQGEWDHLAWEAFLADAAGIGIDLGDESRRNLGNILEAAKYFYQATPAPKKKSSSKTKTKTKAKSDSKAKAKSKSA